MEQPSFYEISKEAEEVRSMVKENKASDYGSADRKIDQWKKEMSEVLSGEKKLEECSEDSVDFFARYWKLDEKLSAFNAMRERKGSGSIEKRDFVAEYIPNIRLRSFLEKSFAGSKILSQDQEKHTVFIDRIIEAIVNPENELEKREGLDHFAEIFIQQALDRYFKERSGGNMFVTLTDAKEDFHKIKGSDFQLHYGGALIKNYTANFDLFAGSGKQYLSNKLRKIDKRYGKEDKPPLVFVYAPVVGSREKKENLRKDCEKAMEQVRKSGEMDFGVFRNRPEDIAEDFVDKITRAIEREKKRNFSINSRKDLDALEEVFKSLRQKQTSQ